MNLDDPEVIRQRIHALIACNKSDMITALPPDRIKTMLENEINRLRLTRTAALDHQDSSEDVEFLGYESEDFRFEHLENEIQFEKCSIEKGEILEIREWIAKSLQSGK
ncbi:7303_t:CDS:2 [Acaulospora morrowiae]|uniref:Signal recognition particle receptor subunit beta n=1 Tax=Acaulospora morrowiae TaxID=94023 RepID=A0A9N9JF84_9GLOM|nr:7303_t:CDS:2 [Acaulospora morrowiae]